MSQPTAQPSEQSATAAPEPQAPPNPRRWWILLVLCLSLLVLVVDDTVLNLAIPSLMRELGATPSDVQWVIDAYVLVFGGLLLTSGSLSDRYGRRRVLVIGLAVFGAASLLSTLSQEPWQLVAGRAFMGLGAALVMPNTLSILITVFDERERRKAIAAWSAVAMVGVIAGPTLGGLLLRDYFWGAVFLINVPIAIVAIVAALTLMPESRGTVRGLDPLGVVLSIAGMGSLVWTIINGPVHGWTANGVPVAAVLAVAALVAFVVWERRVPHPMLPLGLFRERSFRGACLSIVLLSFGAGALLLALTQYLQFVLGYDPLAAGLALLPYAVAAAVSNGIGAGLGRRVSNRTLIVLGLAIVAAGFAVIGTLDLGDGYGTLVTGLLIAGVGGGLAGPAAYTTLMGAVPQEHAGVGSALNDTVQQVGYALSIAVLGSVLAGVYRAAMPATVPEAARESIAGGVALGDPGLVRTAKEAFLGAMSVGAYVSVGFALASALVALVLLRTARTDDA